MAFNDEGKSNGVGSLSPHPNPLPVAMTYLTHRFDLSDHAMARIGAAREGCKIVAGGRRPPESDPLGWAPRRGARLLMITLKQDLAPLQGANWTNRLPEVYASLRPPATFWATLRVANG